MNLLLVLPLVLIGESPDLLEIEAKKAHVLTDYAAFTSILVAAPECPFDSDSVKRRLSALEGHREVPPSEFKSMPKLNVIVVCDPYFCAEGRSPAGYAVMVEIAFTTEVTLRSGKRTSADVWRENAHFAIDAPSAAEFIAQAVHDRIGAFSRMWKLAHQRMQAEPTPKPRHDDENSPK